MSPSVARWPLTAAAILAALIAGYLHGRTSSPTLTVESVKVLRVHASEKREQSATLASTHATTASSTGTVVTRWKACPVCPGAPEPVIIVERVEVKAEERKEASASQQSTLVKASSTSSTEATQSVKVTQREPARYAVGVDGGLTFVDATVLVRGNFSVRAAGNFWLTAWADRAAAGTGARLEF